MQRMPTNALIRLIQLARCSSLAATTSAPDMVESPKS
jgi:hypothetical protein